MLIQQFKVGQSVKALTICEKKGLIIQIKPIKREVILQSTDHSRFTLPFGTVVETTGAPA